MESPDAAVVEKFQLDNDEVVARSSSTKLTFSLLHSLKVPSDFVEFIHKMPSDSTLDSFLEDRLKLTPKLIDEVKVGLEDRKNKDLHDYGIKDGLVLFGWVVFASAKGIGMSGHLVAKIREALKGFKGQKPADQTKGRKGGRLTKTNKEEQKKEKKDDVSWKLSKVEHELHAGLVNILVLINKSAYY